MSVTTSKTGKHGHAKAHIMCEDIFTHRKYEEHVPSTHNVTSPVVEKMEVDVVELTKEGQLTYHNGTDFKDDLDVKVGSELYNKILEFGVENCKVTVISALGQSHPSTVR